MDTEATRAAIFDHFKTGWTGSIASAIPVKYPGQKWVQPTSGKWASLSLQLGDRDSAAIGAARVRQVGVVTLQIFVPEGEGTAPGYKAADHFGSFMDAAQLVPATGLVITFEHAGVSGPFPSGTFQQLNATIPFRVDKTT